METTRVALAEASEGVLAEVLALNEAVEDRTAPLDVARLSALIDAALFAEARLDAEGHVAAFLIGFERGARYDSPNFAWLSARLDSFAYVDRVVVAPRAQGMGLARALYADFAEVARARGLELLACEINRVPANPESDAFHAALGFVEIGQGVPLPGKLVRYMTLALQPDADRSGG